MTVERLDSCLPDQEMTDLILENVADGIFTVDNHFRITFFNRAAERITGYVAADVLGRPCHEVFRASACSQGCPLRRSVRSGRTVKNFEIGIRTRDGKDQTISVSTAPLLDDRGRFRGGVETFRDLTVIKDLQKEIAGRFQFQDIISKNPRMRQIFQTIPNIAQSDSTVLIQGRSGTGKELFATAIHNLSPRASGPLITVNCGALPETLLESELFGHVKGAFTDAKQNRMGRFQAADGGTIFLDEIGDTPLSMQVKLLRVLEHREVQPLGAESSERFDARVLAATNQDLEKLVAEGRFREDLYFRLNVILIQLPDLASRREDIPLLVEHFIGRFNRRMDRPIQGVTERAMAVLMQYSYPGNVRELENVLEHAYIISAGPLIRRADLPAYLLAGNRLEFDRTRRPIGPGADKTAPALADRAGASRLFQDEERERILLCLHENYWNIPRAARQMGIHRTTLWRRVKKLGLQEPR